MPHTSPSLRSSLAPSPGPQPARQSAPRSSRHRTRNARSRSTSSSAKLRDAGSPSTANNDKIPTTADVGTQYTPLGYPPTARPKPVKLAAGEPASQPMVGVSNSKASEAEPPAKRPKDIAVKGSPEEKEDEKSKGKQRAKGAASAPNVSSGLPETGTPSSASSASVLSGTPASPPKRPRPDGSNVKVLPPDYNSCGAKDLGVMIADMLVELTQLNDEIPLKDGILTRFHSRYVLWVYMHVLAVQRLNSKGASY